jgi:hypothetical protein
MGLNIQNCYFVCIFPNLMLQEFQVRLLEAVATDGANKSTAELGLDICLSTNGTHIE